MKAVSWFVAVLTALTFGLMAVSPVIAQEGVELVPFTSETFGVEGVVPAGWSEAAPGVYARGTNADDPTSLIVQAVPGMTAEALGAMLLPQLGIDALPDSTETVETDAFTWTIYEVSVEEAGLSIRADGAIAEDETGVALVLLITLQDDYAALHEAVFHPVVQELARIGSREEAPGEAVYEDPAGRFSVPIPTNWSADDREGYVVLSSPDDLITLSIVVVETQDAEEALAQAWAVADPTFDTALAETSESPAPPLDQFVVYTYEMDRAAGLIVQAQVRVYAGLAYVGIIRADMTELQHRQSQLDLINSGFNITAIEVTNLSDVEPRALTADTIAEFEAYMDTALETYDTPGAAVAVVRDGEIIYAKGFGVRDPEGNPITPRTRMAIGSTTKTMTTLLMAQMVDAGVMDWNERVVEILPAFAVADPEVTQTLTMENLVCACTGVPRRDAELFFNSGGLTAEGIIESLATFEFFTDVGEAFQYSNQMVAAGGYITALAAGGEYGTLYDDYVMLMEERIFSPLGMDSTTFSFDEVLASDNYAIPYGLHMDFTFQPLPLGAEEYWSEPTGPAGEAWSTVLDMAQYMIMELNEGEAADGTRIVSAENLSHTWEPQVAMSGSDSYGLGWIVSDYYGLRMLSHGGNMLGFTTEFAFLPERELGIVVLTNQRLSSLNPAAVLRLLEMLFDQPYTSEEAIQASFTDMRDTYLELSARAERIVEPAVATPAAGLFTNEALGDVEIRLDGESVLIFDAGEFQSELWFDTGAEDDGGVITFLFYDPPLTGSRARLAPDDSGVYQLILGDGVYEYTFERVE